MMFLQVIIYFYFLYFLSVIMFTRNMRGLDRGKEMFYFKVASLDCLKRLNIFSTFCLLFPTYFSQVILNSVFKLL